MSVPMIQRNKISPFLLLLFCAFSFFSSNILLAQSNYNVMFIAIDDMNERAAVFGYPEVLTPNLQRLKNRGVVFTNAYCQFPMCNASRTSLLSGWRPDKTGVYSNDTRPRSVMGQEVKFLPEYFKMYGYHTERVGKILHGEFENDITWDYSDSLIIDELSYANNSGNLTSKRDDPGLWWVMNVPDDSTVNGFLAGRMLQRMQMQPPQPFFLALGLTVHNPFSPALKYWNMYGDSSVQQLLPVDRRGTISGLTGNGSGNIALPGTPAGDRGDIPAIALPVQGNKTTEEWQNAVHAYFAEVTGMDAQLGLILDEMDRQGLWENTVVVLWSDHGQHLGEHEGTWLKNTLMQESDRMPLIVCVPGKQPGTTKALVELVDIYPSLAEICGLPAPTGMEGSSFVRLLDNVKTPWKRAAFTQVIRYDTINEYAVVTKQFRYNSWGTDGEELYDHATDPFEYTNLATNPAYISVLKKMRKILAQGWVRSLPPETAAKSTVLNNENINAVSLQKNDVSAIKVYPNPSNGGRIFVEFKSDYTENIQVTIYNSEGKAVLKTVTEARPGSNQLLFRLAHFAAGVYNIELRGARTRREAKFVIEK